MNEIITLLPLITVFIIFYVILYIPQRRRQKKHKEYVGRWAYSIAIGNEVDSYGAQEQGVFCLYVP